MEVMSLSLFVQKNQKRLLNCIMKSILEIHSSNEIHIAVYMSVDNNGGGSVFKSKTKKHILEEFSKAIEGLTALILHSQLDDKKKRGFCFLQYEYCKIAAKAKCMLMGDKVKVWENVGTVEWADSIDYADPEVIAKVKVLLVGYLGNNVTEEILETLFIQFGKLEQVKKLKHYAFRHFEAQDSVVKAMEEMNAKYLERQKY